MNAQDYKRKIISINQAIGLKKDAIEKYKSALPAMPTVESYDAMEAMIDNLSNEVIALMADRNNTYQEAYEAGISRKQIDEARV